MLSACLLHGRRSPVASQQARVTNGNALRLHNSTLRDINNYFAFVRSLHRIVLRRVTGRRNIPFKKFLSFSFFAIVFETSLHSLRCFFL